MYPPKSIQNLSTFENEYVNHLFLSLLCFSEIVILIVDHYVASNSTRIIIFGQTFFLQKYQTHKNTKYKGKKNI